VSESVVCEGLVDYNYGNTPLCFWTTRSTREAKRSSNTVLAFATDWPSRKINTRRNYRSRIVVNLRRSFLGGGTLLCRRFGLAERVYSNIRVYRTVDKKKNVHPNITYGTYWCRRRSRVVLPRRITEILRRKVIAEGMSTGPRHLTKSS
jgi:hypothetical protein